MLDRIAEFFVFGLVPLVVGAWRCRSFPLPRKRR